MSSRRVVAAGCAAVAALTLGACSSSSPKQSAEPTATTTATTAATTAGTAPSISPTADVRWSALPPAPLTARSGAASAWTGSAFVVWGGRDGSFRALSNGAWYDPKARHWHEMRAAPFGPVTTTDVEFGFGGAREAVIVVGTKAAAYTPASDTWRTLPAVPLQTIDSAAIAQPGAPPWAMLSGQDPAGRGAVAWLDPASPGHWHTAVLRARAPVVLLANGHLVYWYEETKRSGVDLDLANGAQRTVEPMPAALFHGYPFAPGTVAGSLVISPLAQVSWNATTGAYSRTPIRSSGPNGAVASGYCGSATAWTGRELLTWGGSECQGNSYLDTGAEYDPSTGSLRPLPKFLSGRSAMAYAWTGSALLVWGGETGVNGRVAATGAALTLTS